MRFNSNNLPLNLKDKPKEVQEAFLSTANEFSEKGFTISKSIQEGNKVALEVYDRIQKEAASKVQKSASEIISQNIKTNITQVRKNALLDALTELDDVDIDELEEQEQEEIAKADRVLPSKTVKSTEFDKQGRLVTIFEDGTRVISKNAAPADRIDQTVAVQVNPVFDYVRFNTTADTPPHEEGLLFYDDFDHSLCYYNEDAGITVNLGREQLVRVYNASGAMLTDGDVVYINGASQGWPAVYKANANSKMTSSSTLGVVTAAIDIADYGYVCVSGVVHDLNTSAYTEGTILYLDTASGGLTNIQPLQPNYIVEIGTVLSSHTTEGKIYVSIDKYEWHPSVILLDTRPTVTLPTMPQIYLAPTIGYNDGFNYNALTGELEITDSASYAVSILFNAQPSASNKQMYFYAEEKPAGGNWTISRYSARKLDLPNAQETQLTIAAARYYPTGTKIRFYIWGDATISLRTTDLPGTTPGTVTMPAFRLMFAG